MNEFRKKPVTILALPFSDDAECLADLSANGLDPVTVDYSVSPPVLKIETLEGTMSANIGDWIIKGINGEFYPCKRDIFEKTYVPVVYITNPSKPWSCD
jgi:hypothetical protein